MSAIARRYARAAVEAANAQGGREAVDGLVAGLRGFVAAYHDSEPLQQLVENPALASKRDAVLTEVGKKLGLTPAAQTLVRLLAVNSRLAVLDEVVREIEALGDDRASRMRAAVTSAIALSPEHERRIAKALEARVGKPVVVVTEVDPTILGGLVCRVGDLTIDGSVRHQLDTLREQLSSGN